MTDPGQVHLQTLADGRTVEYWDGGDPDGRLLILVDGTPTTHALAPPLHGVARQHGVRLVSASRPGYARSTPAGASLLTTGRDTADLASHLGISEYAVVGVSGGGPFATATAVVDPDRVRVLGIVDSIGPWTQLDAPNEEDAEERALLESLGPRGVEAIRSEFLALAEKGWLGSLRGLDDEARVDAMLAAFPGAAGKDPEIRRSWAVNLRLILDGPYGLEGYVYDNLAWGGPWDVDPSEVRAPTLLWFAEGEPGRPTVHGEWYADVIPGACLTVVPGRDHLEICACLWPETLPALLSAWDEGSA